MLRTASFALVAFASLASIAAAQSPDLYDPANARPICSYNAYVSTWSCETFPVLKDFAFRYAFPQASIGQPGRERAFVNLVNLNDSVQDVVVEYVFPDAPSPWVHVRRLQPKQRLSIGLHMDPVFSSGEPMNFSATVYFSGAGAAEVTWYSTDGQETASKAGTLVPRAESR